MAGQTKSKLSTTAAHAARKKRKSPVRLPQLSVIIVNYNVKDFLGQTLISVKKALKGISSEIIVVENASSDGSGAFIRQRFPDVKLIENKKNLGFAKASNQGLRAARGDYLVLLNPDTIVQEDTFRRMLAYYKKHPDIGILGCKILNPDGSLQLACRRSFPTPWVAFTKLSGLSRLFPHSKLFGKYNLTYLDPDRACEVEAISGSFMMIHRKILRDVGYLDEAFFLYGEDLDWCYRIREKGWKVQYVPDTKIIHFKGQSSKRAQFDQLKVFYQAMSLFVQKHFKQKYLFMSYWLLCTAIWFRASLSFLLKCFLLIAVPLTDFIFLNIVLILSVYFRFGNFKNLNSFMPVILVCSGIWMAMLYHLGSYGKHKYSFSKASFGIVIGFLINASLLYFFKQYAYSRFVVLVGGFLSLLTIPGWRFFAKFLSRTGFMPFKGTIGKTLLARNTLIVGDVASGEKLIKKFNSHIDGGYHISGLVSINGSNTGQVYEGVEVFGSLNDLNTIIKEKRIQEVIFSTSQLSYDRILSLISHTGSHRVNFRLVPSNLEVIIGKATIDRIDDVPLLDLDYKLHQMRYRIMKRSFDILLGLMVSLLVLPIFLYKRYLRASKLQKIKVIGYHNKVFTLYEFEGKGWRFINKIPYLWSLLVGDVSFVGSEISEIETDSRAGFQTNIELKPGLTGLLQVNRHKPLNQDDKQKYNLYYLNNYSPLLDLEIIFKALFKI
ncbi:MAG: glycosyltransferase [bacterium]